MKNFISRLFSGNKKTIKQQIVNEIELAKKTEIEKITQENNVRKKLEDFNSKMNSYFTNPYKYNFEKLSLDLNMTQEKVIELIQNDSHLAARYNNIVFSQKTSADELYDLLLNGIPPTFDTDQNYIQALENPAFNVVYSYYFLEIPTIDYYKLEYEKKLANAEIQKLFKSYIGKSEELKNKIKVQEDLRQKRYKNEFLENDYDEYL
jgi:hypothetical protein